MSESGDDQRTTKKSTGAPLLRIALVNDYEVVVRGLASMLRSYQDVVQIVELDLNKPVSESVDVALCDTFGSTHGDSADVRNLSANPQVERVVVYSWARDEGAIRGAIADGADGYVYKGIPARQLVAALQQICTGGPQVWIDTQGRPPITAGDWPGREEGLTVRESEVLALITQGLSNAEVAERTHLSINSVKTYIRSGYRRIGVTSRTEAVLWGVEHGFRPDRLRVSDPEIPASNGTTGDPDAGPRQEAVPPRHDDEGSIA
ncbi:MAG: helix-turn-helix transcriptional regulator [Microbacterium sp. 14-71-5]|jgi:DNA-binding NarL/FixJ family response regulator|uniref:response regulator transcription factor n=1 Tax=Microbacterium sp. 13-71-7 TaxID=1970399 RepID=UPI000BCB0813|nr:response regulator transcription factor [Microbacterium sp. 13-71-7]OZB83155.1 MAG: helix-turn-helix transcriptional regulator [Microbacterium sp. 13-71-7]OZB87860.1 MAG: helix-turn-helix transcriptional regulator [Microbacterium sp. 14-71-5]